MIINGKDLLDAAPIKDMSPNKNKEHGVSWGLSEVGYDIRVKQEITWNPPNPLLYAEIYKAHYNYQYYEQWAEEVNKAFLGYTTVSQANGKYLTTIGRTALASSVEEFQVPNHLWGELRNKSSHARRFFDATIGTDAEPGWKGFLTIEIIFHGNEPIVLPAGSAIAKTVFHEIKNPIAYSGKYQNQEDNPVPAIFESK